MRRRQAREKAMIVASLPGFRLRVSYFAIQDAAGAIILPSSEF